MRVRWSNSTTQPEKSWSSSFSLMVVKVLATRCKISKSLLHFKRISSAHRHWRVARNLWSSSAHGKAGHQSHVGYIGFLIACLIMGVLLEPHAAANSFKNEYQQIANGLAKGEI